jgi:hypothetical protein
MLVYFTATTQPNDFLVAGSWVLIIKESTQTEISTSFTSLESPNRSEFEKGKK